MPHAASTPIIRRLGLDFSDVPKDWLMDDPVVTTYANGLHLVFPEGERFFIRSVRAYMHRVDDPALKARVKGFVGQEAMHGKEHEASFEMMAEQGYEVQSWLRWYRWLAFDVLERWAPARLCLSVTTALEHLTASLGENALRDDLLDRAHPTMTTLLRWHAAEEIEHKSVAYDVYQVTGGGWLVRMLGMVVAALGLLFFWTSAVRHIRRQNPAITRASIRASKDRHKDIFKRGEVLWAAFSVYARRDFHPDQVDNLGIAAAWLEGAGLTTPTVCPT